MPREVIMPALGMAQDTGLIVAWLKSEGDAVAEGDALFEVETDKATMEVEAQGAGYLTDVSAAEGDSVPVGKVIALISDTAEGTGGSDAAPETEAAPEPEAAPDSTPEGRKVIMPALGMAQDTGRIVAWLVEPGAAVKEGDALFEVETDKATMEVPAEGDGFVAAIYAEAGDDVPVGDVIAILSTEKPDAPTRSSAPKGHAAGSDAKPDATPDDQEDRASPAGSPDKAPEQKPASPAPTGGRILASPKARRLAKERGIDLARLAEAGLGQPFHAADLDRPEATAAPKATSAPTPQAARLGIKASAPAEAFDALALDTGRAALFAALAAGALRHATGADHVAVELRPSSARLDDPDLPRAGVGEGPPALILRDLSATRLTSVQAGGRAVPVITLARTGAMLTVTYDADPAAMDEETATDFVAGLADRIADPLRQLF
ncbi:biotin/lipoyl-containing protein [Palleronia abyssalis]|uniref:Dihydrolipoyllysine-residue acetyltransferase component of pyruvate dehydrogenase complex n=1 Tax=Palleronia abyssalis TaxID=1501240 RepID=A0A2R8BRC7_9RHOB|nr:biotin/lipoyl-containing protein [Palleronia abyssalis]SPJ22698.1 Dihydrolipoyllysine-residue acetyltransferase component of pyruvate dehydrogenase complex [Palleronia abyssalis]